MELNHNHTIRENIMKKSLKSYKKILATFAVAMAAATPSIAMAEEAPFKMVVMKNSISEQGMAQENLDSSIKKLTRNYSKKSSYDVNMGLCVAYLQADAMDKSVNACTAAINSKELSYLDSTKANYFKALGYSNRGISKFKNGDLAGAFNDLLIAKNTDVNTITQSNFSLIEKELKASL